MIIGQDFPKIEFQLFGLDLVEPNAIIGDSICFVIGLWIAVSIKSLKLDHPFFINWKRFFVVFATSMMLGGIGHTFFNYLGVEGKYAGWCLSIVAIYYMEQAMIEIHTKKNQINIFKKISKFIKSLAPPLELKLNIFSLSK